MIELDKWVKETVALIIAEATGKDASVSPKESQLVCETMLKAKLQEVLDQSLNAMGNTLETSKRRKITLKEALELAGATMRRAEEGRLKTTEEEARHFNYFDT
jgi:ribosomal protein L22